MNRRHFVKCIAGSLFVPSILTACSNDNELRLVETIDKVWIGDRRCIIASKEPLTAKIYFMDGQDLIDCHGLCATMELAMIIKEQLEFTPEILKKSYYVGKDEMTWEETEKARTLFREKNRMFRLNKSEFYRLYKACDKVRGPHDCAWTNSKKANIDFWIERTINVRI